MNQNSQGGYSRFSGNNDFMSQVCFIGLAFPINTVCILKRSSEPVFFCICRSIWHMEVKVFSPKPALSTHPRMMDRILMV